MKTLVLDAKVVLTTSHMAISYGREGDVLKGIPLVRLDYFPNSLGKLC